MFIKAASSETGDLLTRFDVLFDKFHALSPTACLSTSPN